MDNNGINNMQPNPNVVPEQPVPNDMNQVVPPQQPMEPNMGQAVPQQPVPPMEQINPNMGQPVPPVNPGMTGPMGSQGEVPVINVEQTPTEVFGQQVNGPQPNDPTRMNQMIDSINTQQQPVEPKYGYNTNEQKPNLNADSNINIKVVIFIAVLIFAFIMALPYLSAMLDK